MKVALRHSHLEKQDVTYIGYDSKLCQHVENFEPNSDIFRSFRHSPSGFADKLLSIQPDFNPIVEKSKEWGQGKSSHEDGDKTKLENLTNKY